MSANERSTIRSVSCRPSAITHFFRRTRSVASWQGAILERDPAVGCSQQFESKTTTTGAQQPLQVVRTETWADPVSFSAFAPPSVKVITFYGVTSKLMPLNLRPSPARRYVPCVCVGVFAICQAPSSQASTWSAAVFFRLYVSVAWHRLPKPRLQMKLAAALLCTFDAKKWSGG